MEKGLNEVREKTKQTWCSYHVAAQILNATAFLFAVEGAGFLVLQKLPGDDCRGVLHVWIVWGQLKPYEQQIYDELDGMAKQLGLRCVRAVGRKGWSRRGYFKPVGIVYEREV